MEMLRLREAGLSYDEIAQRMGLKYRSTPERIIKRALDKREAEAVETVRKLEVARLDRMLDGLTADAKYDEDGKIVSGGAFDGDPKAVAAAVKLMERRARLLGLDMPVSAQPTAQNAAPEIKITVLGAPQT